MEDVSTIIMDYLKGTDDYCPALLGLANWVGDDELVHWFCHSYFANDFEEMKECVGEEDGQILEDYYDLHCN